MGMMVIFLMLQSGNLRSELNLIIFYIWLDLLDQMLVLMQLGS